MAKFSSPLLQDVDFKWNTIVDYGHIEPWTHRALVTLDPGHIGPTTQRVNLYTKNSGYIEP